MQYNLKVINYGTYQEYYKYGKVIYKDYKAKDKLKSISMYDFNENQMANFLESSENGISKFDKLSDEEKQDLINSYNRVKDNLEKQRIKNKIQKLIKAKNEIRRLICANLDNNIETIKFVTLTFKDNLKLDDDGKTLDVKNIGQCNQLYKKFIKRLNKNYKIKVEYITTIEFQDTNERGAVHYHCIFFNCPYIPFKEWLNLWSYGGVWISALTNNKFNTKENQQINNIAAYITKCMDYVTKEFTKENSTIIKRLAGYQPYLKSRGLRQPQIKYYMDNDNIYLENIQEELINNDIKIKYENSYETEFQGKINYKEIEYI